MKNKLSNYSNDDIEKILKESDSFSDVVRKFGYLSITTGNFNTIKNEIKRRGLIIPTYTYKIGKSKTIRDLEFLDCFIENSTVSRYNVKRKIIRNGLIEYKCIECGNTGEWNDKKLILELHHINGINNDNRLENLVFICPNCHSQTPTFSDKRVLEINKEYYKITKGGYKIRIKKCQCGENIGANANRCPNCSYKFSRKIERPSYEILMEEINNTSKNVVAKKYGCSWRTVTKWVKYYEKEMN